MFGLDSADVKRRAILLVNQITDETSSKHGNDSRKRYRGCRRREGHASDEDHGFEALSEDGDERHNEHYVLLAPEFESGPETKPTKPSGNFLFFVSLCHFNTPLLLHFGHPKEGSTQDGNDHAGKKCKTTLPQIFCLAPFVFAEAIEDADDSASDDQNDENAYEGAKPDLQECQKKEIIGWRSTLPA